MKKRALSLAALAALLSAQAALAQDIIRHRSPSARSPIAAAVEVPPQRTTVYLSGAVPPVVDERADANAQAAFGDTRQQTLGVLKAIERSLGGLGLSLGDVVKMQVFLVGDPAKGGRLDFAGFSAAYREFFGTSAQPQVPARSVMQVAGLVNPGWLVEIEVTAVRP